MSDRVTYQLNDSIATIVMDDGKANVLSLKMQDELNAALDQATVDNAVVVLAGRPGRFSAGFDLNTLTSGDEGADKMFEGGFKLAERLLSFPTPVVIACTGHAVAMGSFLLLCGDYRIGVEGSFKIGANEVSIGLPVPRTGIEICRHRLSSRYFKRSIMTAEIFSPVEAMSAGFLDKVVSEEALMNEAQAVASNFSTLNMLAYKSTKDVAMEKMLKELRAAMELDYEDFCSLYGHGD